MKRTIRIKVALPNSIDEVWSALTEPSLLGKWFMENDIKPVVGHLFTFRMAPQKGWDGITYCEVTEVVAKERIAYTYQGTASGEKALACAGVHSDAADKAMKGIFASLDTVLSFSLVPTCGGTLLTMEHTGYKGLKLVIVSLVMGMGWKKQLHKKLPVVLDQMTKGA